MVSGPSLSGAHRRDLRQGQSHGGDPGPHGSMLKSHREAQREDLVKAQARAEKQQKRFANRGVEAAPNRPEGRSPGATIHPAQILQRMSCSPRAGIKLHPDFSVKSKGLLPKTTFQKKDGVNPDDSGPYFGYTSGDAFVERLGLLTSTVSQLVCSQRDYFNRLVDVETDRRLNAEFGDLGAEHNGCG